jgi:hypothetical protein
MASGLFSKAAPDQASFLLLIPYNTGTLKFKNPLYFVRLKQGQCGSFWLQPVFATLVWITHLTSIFVSGNLPAMIIKGS